MCSVNAWPKIGRRTAVALAALSAAALAAAAPALADDHGSKGSPSRSSGKAPAATTTTGQGQSGTQSVRGLVQLVSGAAVTLKQLDGSVVTVPVDRSTKVYIDGKSARLADVKPGFVLVASWKTGRPAETLRFVRPS
jgi:hypothetical protein